MNKPAQPVTLDMTIGDVVEKHSEVAEVMLGYGLQCVGCAVNPYETIEQGALGHGMSEETIQNMLDDINMVVTKRPNYELNPDGITLSPRAIETLELIAESDGKEGAGLQIKAKMVEGGLDYFLDLIEQSDEDEKTLEWKGIKIFVSDESLTLMNPSVIDYLKAAEGEGFKIYSLKESCGPEGCGPEGCGPGGCACGEGGCS